MTDKYRTPFVDVNKIAMDDLPDHTWQAVSDLTEKLLRVALFDKVNNVPINPNLSLGAMQKALAILIAKFFPRDKVEDVAKAAAHELIENAKEWIDLKAE